MTDTSTPCLWACVDNKILYYRQTKTEPQPHVKKISWSLDTWFLRYASGQTYRQTYYLITDTLIAIICTASGREMIGLIQRHFIITGVAGQEGPDPPPTTRVTCEIFIHLMRNFDLESTPDANWCGFMYSRIVKMHVVDMLLTVCRLMFDKLFNT